MKLSLRSKQISGKGETSVANTSMGKRTSVFAKIARFFLRSFLFIVPVGIVAAALPYGILQAADLIQPIFQATNFSITNPSNAFSDLKKDPTLRQDGNGFTNVLIVGVDTRPGNSRLLNTDTIILASYNHKTNEVAMVSFPRDLNVTYPGSSSVGKINATYAYGEMRKAGSGMEYLRQLIETISGQKIQYHVMVDLKGFITIIDKLGGIDVYVDTAFTGDYPTWNYRWTTVKFNKGMVHMNGETALQYARIRHAYPGVEASDFARARRQQKVIAAVIEKSTKLESLQNPKAIFEILKTVAGNIKINRVTPEDVQAGLNILLTKGKPTTYSEVLDPAAGGRYGALVTRGPGYLYNLVPSAGNWNAIKAYLKDYAAVPNLVTTDKAVYFYNKGKKDYAKFVSNQKSRYYYALLKDGGAPKDLPEKGVYYVGGPTFLSTCQYFATAYGIPCIDPATASTAVPKAKDAGVVVVLQD